MRLRMSGCRTLHGGGRLDAEELEIPGEQRGRHVEHVRCSINSRMWSYTDGMQAVTDMSKGIDVPSSWGMSTVMALPPIWSEAS